MNQFIRGPWRKMLTLAVFLYFKFRVQHFLFTQDAVLFTVQEFCFCLNISKGNDTENTQRQYPQKKLTTTSTEEIFFLFTDGNYAGNILCAVKF